MIHWTKIASVTAVVAALAIPGAALAAGAPSGAGTPPSNSGTQNAAAHTQAPANKPGPNASQADKAKAYGKNCQNQSKTHVDGQTGTPFSQCVTAMARLASGTTSSPTIACKTLSKTRAAGQSGTPFSLCVAAGAKLLKSQ
jgi:hypothetical protein